jgi:CRP-like cAMP-binding protein
MQPEATLGRTGSVAAHPLSELLACPPSIGSLLTNSAQTIEFDTGETAFQQNTLCRGLYVVVSGSFVRKTERKEVRLTLGLARAGDLVELAAALGDGLHTYTLTAQTPGSVLLLPMEALRRAFQAYAPLRMQLLEELAREVSRAYSACCVAHMAGMRHRGTAAAARN